MDWGTAIWNRDRDGDGQSQSQTARWDACGRALDSSSRLTSFS